jgi:CheY-like chemotaxis protein
VRLKKIVVVDDSELLHKMYDLVLMRYRHDGATILHARNGSEALAIIRQHEEIDIVLLDINMPVMTGLQLLTGLRALGVLSTLKVVMVSTNGHESDVDKAMTLGASAYITKPFTSSDLHQIIERLCAPSAGGARLARAERAS